MSKTETKCSCGKAGCINCKPNISLEEKPIAVSSEQAEILHFLEWVIDEGFSGRMGFSQRNKAKESITKLWDELALMRKRSVSDEFSKYICNLERLKYDIMCIVYDPPVAGEVPSHIDLQDVRYKAWEKVEKIKKRVDQ